MYSRFFKINEYIGKNWLFLDVLKLIVVLFTKIFSELSKINEISDKTH